MFGFLDVKAEEASEMVRGLTLTSQQKRHTHAHTHSPRLTIRSLKHWLVSPTGSQAEAPGSGQAEAGSSGGPSASAVHRPQDFICSSSQTEQCQQQARQHCSTCRPVQQEVRADPHKDLCAAGPAAATSRRSPKTRLCSGLTHPSTWLIKSRRRMVWCLASRRI